MWFDFGFTTRQSRSSWWLVLRLLQDGGFSNGALGRLVLNEVKRFSVVFALNAVEEFLGMRSDLSSGASSNELFNLLPIFSVETDS